MIKKELIESHFDGIEKKEEIIKNVLETVNNTFASQLSIEKGNVKGDTFKLVDEALKEAGFERPNGKKTTEFLKDVIQKSNLNANGKNEKIEELKRQIKELEESKGADEYLKKKLEEAENQLKTVREQYKMLEQSKDEELKKIQAENKTNLATQMILNSMPKFKEGTSENQIKLYRDAAVKDLIGKMDIIDGKAMFKDDNGNTLLNPSNNQNPYTAKEMLMNHDLIKEIADSGRNIEGNRKPTGEGSGAHGYRFTKSENIEQLHDEMKKAGIDLDTDEGLELYVKEKARFEK